MQCQICFDQSNDIHECSRCHKQTCDHCTGAWALTQLQSRRTNEIKCAFCKKVQDPIEILNKSIQFKEEISNALAKNSLVKMSDVHPCPSCDAMGFSETPGIVKCAHCDRKFDCDHSESFWQRLISYLCCNRGGSSLAWVRTNCKPCPRCKVPIYKDGGCNHVHCSICAVNFCWKCGQDCVNHSRWCSFGIFHSYGGSLIIPLFLLQTFCFYFELVELDNLTEMCFTLFQGATTLYLCALVNYIVIQWFTEDVWRFYAAPIGRSKEVSQSFLFSGGCIVAIYGFLYWMAPVVANIWATCVFVISIAEYRDVRSDRFGTINL